MHPFSAIGRASQPVTTRKPHSASSPNSGTYCFWAPLCPESQRCGLRLGGSDRFELNSSRTGLCHPGKPSATVMLRYLLTNEVLRTVPFKATCQMIEKPQPRQLILSAESLGTPAFPCAQSRSLSITTMRSITTGRFGRTARFAVHLSPHSAPMHAGFRFASSLPRAPQAKPLPPLRTQPP